MFERFKGKERDKDISGSREGGLRAQQTIRERYGVDENGVSLKMREVGKAGGTAEHYKPRGFQSEVTGKDGLTGKERARLAGSRGGKKRWQQMYTDKA